MKDFKSVQDLIIKAALYDKVSTTIQAEELFGGVDALRITFSKKNRYSTACIDVFLDKPEDYQEQSALYACKKALYRLLEAPYEEIECNKENCNDKN